jgi:hypothetical protein
MLSFVSILDKLFLYKKNKKIEHADEFLLDFFSSGFQSWSIMHLVSQ